MPDDGLSETRQGAQWKGGGPGLAPHGNGPHGAACAGRSHPHRMDPRLLVYVLAVLLHVLFLAAWFGLGLRLAAQARTAVAAEPAAGAAFAADGSRTVALMGIFVVLGYAFALAAFFANGGFAAYTPPYHMAVGLGLALVAVHWLLVRPAWARLRATVGGAEAQAARGRIAMGVGIGHLLWLVLLVLMFWDRLVLAAE